MVRTGLGKGSTESSRSISRHSFQCLCQLFMAHPNFNFTRHIVQFIVPYLDCGDQVSCCPEFKNPSPFSSFIRPFVVVIEGIEVDVELSIGRRLPQ